MPTIEKEDLADWKTYLRWHLANDECALSFAAFVNENFDFLRQDTPRARATAAAVEAVHEDVDNDLGEALGQAYVAKYFSPEAKQQAAEDGEGDRSTMQHDIETLPWMRARPRSTRSRSCTRSRTRWAIRTAGATTARLRSCAATKWATSIRARRFRVPTGGWQRSASPWTAGMGHDAADGECGLRSAEK